MTIRVLSIFGTRPEAIKMAPVIIGLREDDAFEAMTCVTAQHRNMLDHVLDLFDIQPDFDLNTMKPDQDLFDITSNVMQGVGEVLRDIKPDLVLVHGDTTTCFAAALASFYERVDVGHVEAGLRTGDIYSPFPEEINRCLVTKLALYHFAPTSTSCANLLDEGVPEKLITITGNTVIDALHITKAKTLNMSPEYWQDQFGEELYSCINEKSRKLILVTGHRRENFGSGFLSLCSAIKELALSHGDWDFVYPVHLNPNVRKPVKKILSGIKNIWLLDPLSYLPFVWLMDNADVILTDSGGIQEEGPALGKPVLVMRDVTERPEALEAGTVKLVGTGKTNIVREVERVLLDRAYRSKMIKAKNPYGDGKATEKILRALKKGSSP